MSKIAIVLCNLGGPDEPKAVRPFLFNLFNDRAIIGLPQPLRVLFATTISFLRARKTRRMYKRIGGASPLLENVTAQAEALEKRLKTRDAEHEYKCFVAMRYWHPMSELAAKRVKSFGPDRVILLPLYPQYSTTTTGSSFRAWDEACEKVGLSAPTSRICCYPADLGFVATHAKLIRDAYWKASEHGKPRLLFSAHGLPQRVIDRGDPYQWHIERAAEAITQILSIDDLDWRICYQSRVGPMKWIGPSTEQEIVEAGVDQVPLLIVPIAFTSEHSETLYELDILYRQHAGKRGVPDYWRAPALSLEPLFIETLADLCQKSDPEKPVSSFLGKRYCSKGLTQCPCAA